MLQRASKAGKTRARHLASQPLRFIGFYREAKIQGAALLDRLLKGATIRAIRRSLPLFACSLVVTLPLIAGSLLAPSAKADEAALTARDARLAGDMTRTRFVMDLSEPVKYSISMLADPYRVILDMPEIAFAFDEGAGHEGRGLISAWRYGLFAAGKSRIVLDAAAPVTVDKVFILPSVDKQPARLVLDLVKTTREDFLANVVKPSAEPQGPSKGDRLTDRRRPTRPVIVLDPGHGGIDTGATGSGGTLEKAVALDFASLLKRKLEEGGRYDVHLTRETDLFIPLRERVSIARALQADLFISIHAEFGAGG